MMFPKSALPVWFGFGRKKDAQYLRAWRNAPLTYFPDQEITDTGAGSDQWNVDRYEVILGQDANGAFFQHAAQLVLTNQFYPAEIMTSTSDFQIQGRTVRTGDRILQRIPVFQYNTLPILDVLTMNEITEVTQSPRRVGFTYTTTQAHSEIGEWSPSVEWRENGEVALIIEVISRTRPGASLFARRLTRRMQLHAHRVSIQNFQALLSGRRRQLQRSDQNTSLRGPLLAGILVGLIFLLRSNKRTNSSRSY